MQSADKTFLINPTISRLCVKPFFATSRQIRVAIKRTGEVEKKVKWTAMCDGECTRIYFPKVPGAAGKFEAYKMVGELKGYTVSTEREVGDKACRAEPFAAQCEHGFVKLLEAPWNNAFVDELCAFPNGAHDDQVEAVCGAFRTLVRRPQCGWIAV